MRRIILLLVAAMLLSSTVFVGTASASDGVGTYRWKYNELAGYSSWVRVCHWQKYPLPGGYGGAYWEALHRAVDTWNAQGGELHYSLTSYPCGSQVPEPYVAVGYMPNQQSLGFTNMFFEACGYWVMCVRHADTTLSSLFSWNTDEFSIGSLQYDAQSAFEHELGHPMQLNDLSDSNESNCVMYGSMGKGYFRRTITSIDRANYATWYGTTH